MPFRWVYTGPAEQGSVRELHHSLGVSKTIARLLTLRNIHTCDQARSFLKPQIDQLHDPFLMRDMEKASLRLSRAIRSDETVLVYGDYDVDGTTGIAALLLFLQEFGVDVHFDIPCRFKDGCGVGPEAVREAASAGASLIITVDCGISAFEAADLARSLGIDMIVCDHHTVGEQLPDAHAILNPKRPDCDYPFDGLSGAGVGFKLIQATVEKLGLGRDVATRYLDLIAISIASDIVPLIDENRVMMSAGLDLINRCPRPGIQALLKQIHARKGSVQTSTLVFSIGPRINAAGRLGDAAAAVSLMISRRRAEAERMAAELEAINTARREVDALTMKEAVQKVEREVNMDQVSSLVLHSPDWHLGVIGIVASRLVDLYSRPVILLTTVDGMIKGSARSVRGFNIYEALKACDDLLVQFGGHQYAAGMTLKPSKLDKFKRRIDELASLALADNDFVPELKVDLQIDLNDVDREFLQSLNRFRPFGPGNVKPVFVSKGVELSGLPTIVGKGHLKMRFRQRGSGVFDAIGFHMHDYLPMVRDTGRKRIDIAYEVEENHWNGNGPLQLKLRDIHLEQSVGYHQGRYAAGSSF